MRLQVTQENLAKALQTVARVASTRSTLPILANVLLKTQDKQLSVAATNLDIAITYTIGAKIQEDGEITVPARLIQEFVSNLRSGIVTLELNDNKLNIKTEHHQSTINGTSTEDFPSMPTPSNAKEWKVESGLLTEALQSTVVAASNDEARPVLTGVLLHVIDGDLFVVATDSYRLAEKKLIKYKNDTNLLVPVTAMQELLRIISEDIEEVNVSYDEQQVLFVAGQVELVSRLIDGKYPQYKKLIPTSFQTSAILQKEELSSVTKVSSLFAKESAGSVQIKVNESNQELSIHSIASQVGENTSTASAEVKGEGSITLNSRYILDALHALKGQRVEFAFNGKLDPCLLRDPDDDSYIHIIMPLKS